MLPIPPLSFSGGAAYGGSAGGGTTSWSQGDWNVNVGSGSPIQSGGMSPLMLIGLAVAVYLVWKK